MSAKEYDLSRVQDMPDLKTWYAFARFLKEGEPIAVTHTFIWRDDGNPGVIASVEINGQAVDLSGGKA